MTKDEALKLALETLEYWDMHGKLHQPTEEAITAIKEALAQEQEPVAEYIGENWDGSIVQLYEDLQKGTKLYTAPPQRTKENK